MQPRTKKDMTPIIDILNRITPGTWFPIKEICDTKLTSSIRVRIEGIKEIERREKPGNSVKKFYEYYVSKRNLDDIKKRIDNNGRIRKTRNPKQKIIKNDLTIADKLYNRFLGVKC